MSERGLSGKILIFEGEREDDSQLEEIDSFFRNIFRGIEVNCNLIKAARSCVMRKITIEWSYPMDIDNILYDERMSDIGIYYITRNFGGHISDLYIGKTVYSYKSRLESHWWYWLDNYRGKKFVRLGTIVKPQNISDDEIKQLINDAEATLIFCLRDQLIHNKMCTVSCNPSQRLKITSIGRRGNIPAEVFIPDAEWIG